MVDAPDHSTLVDRDMVTEPSRPRTMSVRLVAAVLLGLGLAGMLLTTSDLNLGCSILTSGAIGLLIITGLLRLKSPCHRVILSGASLVAAGTYSAALQLHGSENLLAAMFMASCGVSLVGLILLAAVFIPPALSRLTAVVLNELTESMKSRFIPLSIKFVSGLFLVIGLIGLARTIVEFFYGRFLLAPEVTGLLIARGLIRLRSGWNWVALIAASAIAGCIAYWLLMRFVGFGDFLVSQLPESMIFRLYLLYSGMALVGIAMLWTIRILTLASVRVRFQVSPTTDRSNAIRASAILLLGLCGSRLTGGLELVNLSRSSWNGSGISLTFPAEEQSQDFDPSNPIFVEFHVGTTAPSEDASLSTHSERPANGSANPIWTRISWTVDVEFLDRDSEIGDSGQKVTRRTLSEQSWLGDHVPSGYLSQTDKFIVHIEEPTLTGLYWMPLIKCGGMRCSSKIRGMGKFKNVPEIVKNLNDEFTIVGLDTTSSIRKQAIARGVASAKNEILTLVIKNFEQNLERTMGDEPPPRLKAIATSEEHDRWQLDKFRRVGRAGWSYTLADLAILERRGRDTTLPKGLQILSDHYDRLGDAYYSSGNYADAVRAYQDYELWLDQSLVAGRDLRVPGDRNATIDRLRGIAWKLSTNPAPSGTHGSLAVSFARRACELADWRQVDSLEALAAAYAECGNFEQAIQWQNRAMGITSSPVDKTAGQRLTLYQSRQPYRDLSGYADRVTARGDADVNSGSPLRAIASYTEALRVEPDHVEALKGRAGLRYDRREYAKAIEDFDAVLRIQPQDEYALKWRGAAHQFLSHFREAVSDYTHALHSEPTDIDLLNWRGDVYTDLLDYSLALQDYTSSLHILDAQALVHGARGQCLDKLNRQDEALKEFRRVIEIDPSSPWGYHWQGLLHSNRGEYRQAIDSLDAAIRVDSEFHPAHVALTWIYATALDPSVRDGFKAVDLGYKACKLSNWKDSNDVGNLACAYAEAGMFEEAVDFCSWAFEMNESDKKEWGFLLDLFEAGISYQHPLKKKP